MPARRGETAAATALTAGNAAAWEHFAHGADIGVRGFGASPAQAFENAARALVAVMVEPGTVKSVETVPINCAAPDLETLLLDWLNALIYEIATRGIVFGDFSVSIADGRLQAEARGEAIDVARHAPAVEIKGATYTELKVVRSADGKWLAQCIVDV